MIEHLLRGHLQRYTIESVRTGSVFCPVGKCKKGRLSFSHCLSEENASLLTCAASFSSFDSVGSSMISFYADWIASNTLADRLHFGDTRPQITKSTIRNAHL